MDYEYFFIIGVFKRKIYILVYFYWFMINTSKEIARDVEMSNLEDEDFRNKVWVDLDKLVEVIKEIEVYRGLVSKIEAWSNSGDALCDLIEDRYKEELLKILGVDEE